MLDAVSTMLSHPIVDFAIYFAFGWWGKGIYTNWRYGDRYKELELINNALAHQIIANRAIAMLTSKQKEDLEKEVNEAAEDQFVQDMDFEIVNGEKLDE